MDLREFQKLGQSIWLDYLRRDLIESGALARLVRDDDVRGITTNPDIFNKAISESADYDGELARDVRTRDESPEALYERIVVDDIQKSADVLRPVFDASDGRDGFVSMEVSPHLAHDTEATLEEARRLWTKVRRDNVMIKVPGTVEGFPAVEQLTSEGINVNITLLFGRRACTRVHEAYMSGLEKRIARGQPIDRLASVASMFVSRIDVLVEEVLRERLASATGSTRAELQSLIGTVGIANAKLGYDDWKRTIKSPRWKALAARGARPQRMLWASTSTKSKELSDVHYVEALIGPDTIDTIPPKTLDAVRDHGVGVARLEEGLDAARSVMDTLARAGISIEELADRLVEEGLTKFATSFDAVIRSVGRKRDQVLARATATA